MNRFAPLIVLTICAIVVAVATPKNTPQMVAHWMVTSVFGYHCQAVTCTGSPQL